MMEGEGGKEEKKVCSQDDLAVNRFVSHMRWTQGDRRVKATGGRERGEEREGGMGGGTLTEPPPVQTAPLLTGVIVTVKWFYASERQTRQQPDVCRATLVTFYSIGAHHYLC